jgi:hypothetical protein
MKKFFFVAVAALFVFCATASAQFVNSNSSQRTSHASYDVESVFNTFDLTYSPLTLKSSEDGDAETQDFNAISLNWNQARLLTSNLPIYLTYGAGLQYAWKTDSENEDNYSYRKTISFLTIKVPVNVMYNFNIPNTSVNLMPYVGLNLQGHILGQNKYSYEYDGETESESYSFFSKDDMGEDAVFNRIVLGWQIGAKVSFNKYFFGVAYQGPVTNLYKEDDFKINYSQVNVSLGIMF